MKRLAKSFIAIAILLVAVGASLTACATRDIPYATLQARYELPGGRYYEPSPGLRIHYLDEGVRNGPTLVLVHGFAASVHAWRPWVARLKARYRLISLDLPGHGLTETPKGYHASLDSNGDLAAGLATSLGVDRFVLVGNSMGGAVAWDYALRHPERLDGLVLIDSAGWPGKHGASGPPAFVGALIGNPLGRAIAKTLNPRDLARSGLKSAYLDPALVTDDLIARYGDLALAPGHRDILLTMKSRPDRRVTAEDFAAIKTPTLVMAGEQDKLIPVAQSRAIAAAIPGAHLVTYNAGGHVPMEQLPDASAADLTAFLETLPSARADGPQLVK
jgi:pimeloyl-ACP methyl ester carboxylesterase